MLDSSNRLCVLVEQEKGQVLPLTLELLYAGKKLADKSGDRLCACILGRDISILSSQIAQYTDEVYAVDNNLLADFQADLYAFALETACRAIKPATLLMGHSHDNLELAPKIASRLESDLITDCVGLEHDADSNALLCTKPVYGGNAVAVFELERTPRVVTVRPKVYEAMTPTGSQGQVTRLDCDLTPSIASSRSTEIIPGQSVSLDKAEAIVSGGRGVKTQEDIAQLRSLIDALKKYFDKVELGASRPVIDVGLLSRSHQIGQTGEKVSPQLYIAIAISGATRHITGIVGSKKILAINKDGEAPIFDFADYGVVGSFEGVMPAFIEQLERLS
jgi:electron transfer flavoprotein alpha subunit